MGMPPAFIISASYAYAIYIHEVLGRNFVV